MDNKTELGVWILLSLVLAMAGAWLLWRFRLAKSRSLDWLRRRLVETTYGRLFLELIRLAYYVGLPYAAVLRRALSLTVIGVLGEEFSAPAILGWTVQDWASALGWMAIVSAIAAVTLGLGWRNAVRASDHQLAARGMWPISPAWVTLRETLYNEIHWAFYRAGPLLILGDAYFYWAILISAAFPLLEWALDPDWWVQINDGPRREQVLMQCLWLATSTIYFSLARNVWLAFAMHLVLALGLNYWLVFVIGNAKTAEAERA